MLSQGLADMGVTVTKAGVSRSSSASRVGRRRAAALRTVRGVRANSRRIQERGVMTALLGRRHGAHPGHSDRGPWGLRAFPWLGGGPFPPATTQSEKEAAPWSRARHFFGVLIQGRVRR